MFIKDLTFEVEFTHYSEKNFCKDFLRKYGKKKWIETRKTIIDALNRSFLLQNTKRIDNLRFFQEDEIGIFKLDFSVAGTNFSPKASGNRAIFYLCNNTGKINILLVYAKDHCDKKCSETQWIFKHIKTNFPEYRKYC
ncbi:hypothetical protein HZA43_05715 [Candidatus Peregrinibacteria bacterium]|nr:hypothetical protein [Candidatus Peregrinibacteria bacterium]